MKNYPGSGFTLVELLVVVVILGIVAVAAIPVLSGNDPQKLTTAAVETANTLRFALSEAKRTGGYVLVDGKTTAGVLQLFYSNASAQVPPTAGTALVNDPLTKRAAVLDVASSAFSRGVTLTPQFRAGGSPQLQLLIGPGLTQMRGFNGPGLNMGALEANSKVTLAYGSLSTMVNIDAVAGLVSLP